MKTQIGITPENLAYVSHGLNTLLADEYMLYTKTRNAHWNVEGRTFTACTYSLNRNMMHWMK